MATRPLFASTRKATSAPIGLHFTAAQAISEYLAKAGLTSGFLFRPRLGPRSQQPANRAFESSGLYLLIEAYLEQLPGAMKEEQLPHGSLRAHCIYTPHSLRATTAGCPRFSCAGG